MIENKFKYILTALAISAPLSCLAHEPPFSGVVPKPPIHPYTYFGPQSTPMDLQQMRYLRDKYGTRMEKQGRETRGYIPYEPPAGHGIRPTGHRTYFMNIPRGDI